MAGILLVHAQRALSSLPRMPKPAIASSFLGLVGIIHSLVLKNNTYLTAAILWTAASSAVGYLTRQKRITVQRPCNILNHSGMEKISFLEFYSQTNSLYSSRCKKPHTTHEQRKKFYYLMCVSHLFSPNEKKQLGNSLNDLGILRPYMEDSLYLSKKVDLSKQIPPNPLILSGYILRHRDHMRLQVLEEFEKYGKIPLTEPRFTLAIHHVFDAIQKGILENPSIQDAWRQKREGSTTFRFGEDDALLYFQRKFFKTSPQSSSANSSSLWNRFFEVKPIHSNVTTIRRTEYEIDNYWF